MTRPATPGGLCTLYPDPGHVALEGLYLGEELRRLAPVDEVLFYANFIASLDGRIAVAREAG
ncbi:MAG: pyrimidine reductase, partial [Gammaproteobacteria bacterium]|nr:pyrimidine reductase [Gammaproteobacteria bacterium]